MSRRYIINCNLDQFDRMVQTHNPARIVSIVAKEQVPQTPDSVAAEKHLALSFNDISTPIKGMTAVMPDDIVALLNFAKHWQEDAPLLIHCWMGISRSTATALSLCCLLNQDFSEGDWALHLRKAAPSATPNPRIIALMDEALGREGRLIAAVKRIGRGANASMGKSFTLKPFGRLLA